MRLASSIDTRAEVIYTPWMTLVFETILFPNTIDFIFCLSLFDWVYPCPTTLFDWVYLIPATRPHCMIECLPACTTLHLHLNLTSLLELRALQNYKVFRKCCTVKSMHCTLYSVKYKIGYSFNSVENS